MDEFGKVELLTEPYCPRTVYAQRLKALEALLGQLGRKDALLANGRLIAFLFAVVTVILAAWLGRFSMAWALPSVVVFAVLAFLHARVLAGLRGARLLFEFYEQRMQRLDGTWRGKGVSGEDFAPQEHAYARDLDIYGSGSLYEYLCVAKTKMGRRTLAAWLNAPASPSAVRERQQAVAELSADVPVRERLVVCGEAIPGDTSGRTVLHWVAAPPGLRLSLLSAGIWATLAGIGGGVALSLLVGVPLPAFAVVLATLVFYGVMRKSLCAVVRSAFVPIRELELVSRLLRILEESSFRSPLLVRLEDSIRGQTRSSQCIAGLAQLHYLCESLYSSGTLLIVTTAVMAAGNALASASVVSVFLLAQIYFPYLLEKRRIRDGIAIRGWMSAVGELEALCSLAAYAHESAEACFPEIVDEGPLFEARAMGHPLLPAAQCVCNDLMLGPGTRLFVVSGCNMSGKTTLLRTAGMNGVLALAGAPVRAAGLRLSPLRIHAAIEIRDSLQRSVSRFYEEILRIKQAVDATAGPECVLFLFDELLHGTNSQDRYVGGTAVIRDLIGKNAIGLITTHDLALTRIVEALPSRAANIHFSSRISNGRLSYDYVAKPGVVNETNAIALMRSVGLLPPEEPDTALL